VTGAKEQEQRRVIAVEQVAAHRRWRAANAMPLYSFAFNSTGQTLHVITLCHGYGFHRSCSCSSIAVFHRGIHVFSHFIELLKQNAELFLQRGALQLERFVVPAEIRYFLHCFSNSSAAYSTLRQREHLLRNP
jgi:hypothetical protein